MRLQLGTNSSRRAGFGEPDVLLVNAYFEDNPNNQVDGVSLLSRPGRVLTPGSLGTGPITAVYTLPGLFTDNLFMVSGSALLSRTTAGVTTTITGTIGTTFPQHMAGVYSPLSDRLFIADGVNLQYYGGLPFINTLTLTPGAISDDVVVIDGVHYKFTTVSGDLASGTKSLGSVFLLQGAAYACYNDTVQIGTKFYKFTEFPGAPGTGNSVSDPIQVTRGTSNGGYSSAAMANLALAVRLTGTAGTHYSTAATINPDVEVIATTEYTISLRSLGVGSAANAIPLAVIPAGADDGVRVSGPTMGSAIDSGGSLAAPYFVFVNGSNTNALANLRKAVNASGVAGTDYSVGVVANARVDGTASTSTTFSARSREAGVPIPVIAASVIATGGADGLAWATANFAAGSIALYAIPTPDAVGIAAVAVSKAHVFCMQTNSQRVWIIPPGSVTINALDFVEAESEPDTLVDLITLGDEIMFIGKSTIEPWYVTGEVDSLAAPVRGRAVARGALPGTAVKVDSALVFVGDDFIPYTLEEGLTPIGSANIAERIRKNPPLVSNRAWTFALDTHKFYVLHLGTAETLVYDFTTERWSQWKSATGNRWEMANGVTWNNGGIYACKFTGAELYQLLPNSFLDESATLITRVSQAFYPVSERDGTSCGRFSLRAFPQPLEAEETGAQVTLSFSDDDGATYFDAGSINRSDVLPYPMDAEWRSLGKMATPGRLFRVTDEGLFSRIDGVDLLVGKPKTKGKTG